MERIKFSLALFTALILLAFTLPPPTLAEDTKAEKAALELLELFEAETEIATKTKLNADFVPGMVTVLYGDDLEARGVHNVWEALGLIPGIELTMVQNGSRQIIVRGLGKSFSASNVRFLLNGTALAAATSSIPSPLLDIRSAQIDRIEIVRGPGSAVHGEYASLAIVNVITKREGNRVFAGAGRYHSFEGGGILSVDDDKRDMRFSLNFSAMATNGADVTTGPDKLFGTANEPFSNAPGPSNEMREAESLNLHFDYKNFSLQAGYLRDGNGDHFSPGNILPSPEKRIASKHWIRTIEARQKLDVNSDLNADMHLGWLKYNTRNERLLSIPPGSTLTVFFPPPPHPVTYPDGKFSSSAYEESKRYGGLDLNWTGWERHNITAGISYSEIRMGDDIWRELNYDPTTGAPLPSMQRFASSYNPDNATRTLRSLALQDQIKVSKPLTLTGSVRYDDYDDMGSHYSPRLAGVYERSDDRILKLQYAKAFRPPSFTEMYNSSLGNTDLKSEMSDTYEFSYIHRRGPSVLRLNLFYVEMKDFVTTGTTPPPIFQNSGRADLRGAGLEFEQRFLELFKLDANLSYADSRFDGTDGELPGAANWLSNLGLYYEPASEVLLNLQYRYVGERSRETTDTRSELDAYHTFDLTGNLFNLWSKGLTLRAGVKNLFNEDVRYPARVNSYPDDYPRPGRSWWTHLSYDF